MLRTGITVVLLRFWSSLRTQFFPHKNVHRGQKSSYNFIHKIPINRSVHPVMKVWCPKGFGLNYELVIILNTGWKSSFWLPWHHCSGVQVCRSSSCCWIKRIWLNENNNWPKEQNCKSQHDYQCRSEILIKK